MRRVSWPEYLFDPLQKLLSPSTSGDRPWSLRRLLWYNDWLSAKLYEGAFISVVYFNMEKVHTMVLKDFSGFFYYLLILNFLFIGELT